MSDKESLIIVPLTREYAIERADDILALEHNWTEIGDEPWTHKNLLLELPKKWELSHVGLLEDKIAGYQIGSAKNNSVWLNKIIVDKSIRGNGTGRHLLRAFLQESLKNGYEKVKFRVRSDNPAVAFYQKIGFTPTEEHDYSRLDGVKSYFYDSSITNILKNV